MNVRLRLGSATAGHVCVLVVVALVAYGLKRHYADASTDALAWILMPTAHLVALVTGVSFAAVPGEGYFSAERMFLIEKACAGVNFMIAAFAMVALMLLYRVRSVRAGAAVLGASLLASYLAAVIVNGVRIVIAMWLAAHPTAVSSLSAADIHRLEGIVVYFGGLLLLYALVQRIDRARGATWGWVVLPLGSYYFITLVVPLANGVQAGRFFAHAVIVLLVPPVLILLVYAGHRLFYRGAVFRRDRARTDVGVDLAGPGTRNQLPEVSALIPRALPVLNPDSRSLIPS